MKKFLKFLLKKKKQETKVSENLECCICYNEISKTELVVLPCSHCLDIKCFEKYKEVVSKNVSFSLKCPICRISIEPNEDKCKICNENMDKESVNYIKNVNCGCEFHYTCYEKKNNNYYQKENHQCFCCNKAHEPEHLEVYSYLYFPEGYSMWVSDLKDCIKAGCNNYGNPKSCNYCSRHSTFTAKNNEVVKAFKYFTQKGIGMNRLEKEKLFMRMMIEGEKV